jgi:cyclopropane fatty-acyl-phospholipid synthase-like methyltransferase
MADANVDLRASRRDLVRRGYDVISRAYRDDEGRARAGTDEDTDHYAEWVAELARLLRPGATVLDLGCGAGVPATKLLTERNVDVLGLDISAVQIARARKLVPAATFVQADMVTWEHEPASFDAVVSFYALIHVPIQDQRDLLPKIRRWLRPAGYLLAIVGSERWSGIEDYLGTPMFWDHADRETYLGWLARLGSCLFGTASCPRATLVIRW